MEDAESNSPRWRDRILSVPGLILLTAITGATSWSVAHVLSGVDRRSGLNDPVAVSIETNPARIGGFSDLGQSAVIPRGAQVSDGPGQGCEGFHPWVRRHGGVDARFTMLRIVVQGKALAAVSVSAIRALLLSM